MVDEDLDLFLIELQEILGDECKIYAKLIDNSPKEDDIENLLH